MDPFKQQGTSRRNSKQQQQNPFARALAETESHATGNGHGSNSQSENLQRLQQMQQRQALNNLSGENGFNPQQLNNQQNLEQLQQEKKEELKKKQMREKLHRMVNPVEQNEIFSAKKERSKARIEEVRKELKKLAAEIAKFYKEVDVTLTQEVASPGMEGTYHQNFFEKLKQWIQMLRQKVRSARTWAKQMKQKKKKKKRHIGLNFKANEAKATHDMLHHERSNAYSGA